MVLCFPLQLGAEGGRDEEGLARRTGNRQRTTERLEHPCYFHSQASIQNGLN
jgi:hypothetical protein